MVKKKLVTLIVASGIALVGLFFVGLIIISSNSFSATEQLAVKYTDKLYRMMKVPNSFTLYDDILYLKTTDSSDYDGAEYLFIDYTAENSYGAALIGYAVFIDGVYYDRSYTKPSRDDYDISDKSEREEYQKKLEEAIIVSKSRLALSEFELLLKFGNKSNANIKCYEVISSDKIANKLGIKSR